MRKLHKQYAHPSADRLYNLLKTAGLETVDQKTLKVLEDIMARCDLCQRIGAAAPRLRVTMGYENTWFNSKVYMNVPEVDSRKVLHMVDATRFSDACILTRQTALGVWEAILRCWASVYTGLPHITMVDEGTEYKDTFAELCEIYDMKLDKSGIQAHSALGVVMRYHAPLCNVHLKFNQDHINITKETRLAITVNAMNDILGPGGIVSSAPVFGKFPSVRSSSGPAVARPMLQERGMAASDERTFIAQHLDKSKIKRALEYRTPSA